MECQMHRATLKRTRITKACAVPSNCHNKHISSQKRVFTATTYHAHNIFSNMMEKKEKPFQPNKGAKKPTKKSNAKPVFRKVQRNGVREDEEIKTLQTKYASIDTKNIRSFNDFPLSRKTMTGLQKCKYKKPTDIQQQSIGHALQGKDILGAAITGSGKTLAFLIPMMEMLFVKKWVRQDGVGAIIISPTRELAYQIFETLKKIGAGHDFSAGLIIGGKNLKFERSRMDQMNVIICTPGRLLQHMDENPLFDCSSMQMLVLDEADRCLDMGFEDTMNAIIENLPAERQTLLFSATQTRSVKDLARLSLRDPVYVAPHEQQAVVTPSTLKQNYVVIGLEDKLTMLWSFIKNHLKQKTIVFMATCKQVKYVHEVFSKLRPGVAILPLYGTMHQDRRMAVYDEFCRKSAAVMVATDLAARGLDFPTVHWSIQLDAPENRNEYLHRAGRTARHKSNGESLLILLPSEEEGMIKELTEGNIHANQIQIDPKKMFSPKAKIEAFLAQNKELKDSAQRALISYVKSVALMKNKEIFKPDALNIEGFAQSLGLLCAPRIKFLQNIAWLAQKKKAEQRRKDELANVEFKAVEDDEEDDSSSDEDDKGSDVEESDSGEENDSGEEEGSEEEDDEEDDDESDSEEEEAEDAQAESTEKAKSTKQTAMSMYESSDEEDDIFTIKRRDHEITEDSLPEVADLDEIKGAKKDKVVTKAALAKKLIKKKILPNKKTEFDEEGNKVESANALKSDLAKEYEQTAEDGIDIEKAQQLIREEDKFDKERFKQLVKAKHREKKLKAKKEKDGERDDFGSDEDEYKPDLSWLPDPNKLYAANGDVSDSDDDGRSRQVVNASSDEDDDDEDDDSEDDDDDDDDDNEEEEDSDNEMESEEETVPASIQNNKKRKLAENSDDEPKTSKKIKKITSKLNVDDAEAFAMKLLSK